MTASWQQAMTHFVRLLPRTSKTYIVADERHHRRIVAAVTGMLDGGDVTVLWLSDPELGRVAISQRDDDTCGLISFIVPDATAPFPTRVEQALAAFDTWPQHRMKVCFDVADSNFADLFRDAPEQLRDRCTAVRRRLAELGCQRMRFTSDAGSDVSFDVRDATWIAYTGFEPFDYVLPSGEVACRPNTAEGTLALNGWIVGSIPFGQKYGRIRPGEAVLGIEKGRVVVVRGSNIALCADLDTVLALPGVSTIGELGLGQSEAVAAIAETTAVGYQWHERQRGMHVGFGAELPEVVPGADRHTDYHLDMVFAHGSLATDGTAFDHW